jgi:hypothetical protein
MGFPQAAQRATATTMREFGVMTDNLALLRRIPWVVGVERRPSGPRRIPWAERLALPALPRRVSETLLEDARQHGCAEFSTAEQRWSG